MGMFLGRVHDDEDKEILRRIAERNSFDSKLLVLALKIREKGIQPEDFTEEEIKMAEENEERLMALVESFNK